jgi:hypothetical protein
MTVVGMILTMTGMGPTSVTVVLKVLTVTK